MPPQGSEWEPVTAGLRDWRTQMTAEDVERFEAAAGDLLAELAYARAFSNLRPEAVEYSVQVRTLLANEPRGVRPYGQVESSRATKGTQHVD
jgi:hypothetical protein